MLIRPTKPLRTAPGESAEQWLAALADPAWLAAAKVLKEDGGSWVRRATILGRDVVVKCRPLSSLSRRVKAALRMGHGHKHWRGAKLLQSRGIPTATPLLLCRASVNGTLCEILVLEFIAGPTLLECMAMARDGKLAVREQHAIARAAGEQVMLMQRKVIWNRDHKPSNLIVQRSDPAHLRIAVIDCVGISWWNFTMGEEVERMFTDLMLEPLGCKCPPRQALWLIALGAMADEKTPTRKKDRHFALTDFLDEIKRNIQRHGDPTPKVNPLRPPRT